MKSAAAFLVAVLIVAGCVDHDLNARKFCDRHEDLLAASRDEREVAADKGTLEDREDEIEESMKHAEDGTRAVRLAARDVLDGYDKLAGLVDDDDAEPDEITDAKAELREARADLRDACADVDG
jgi:hypothetical protein